MLPDTHARDPQRDIVFTNKTDAARYTGHVGQTTYTIDRANDCLEQRFHDGEVKGGHLIASGSVAGGSYITARVLNVPANIPAAGDPAGPLVLSHSLGYYPLVQVLDLTQSPAELIEVEVAYTDLNTIELTAGVAGATGVMVLMR